MKYLLLAVYIPNKDAERLKTAIFAAGAGKVGNYSHCCWQTEGLGQFMPEENSNPTLGQAHKIHHEPELKIEFILPACLKEKILTTMQDHHPYETPAYFLTEIIT